jgi:hypothetical protein
VGSSTRYCPTGPRTPHGREITGAVGGISWYTYYRLEPNQTTSLQLLGQGECGDRWLVTEENGTVVKDSGQICWHDTITIP